MLLTQLLPAAPAAADHTLAAWYIEYLVLCLRAVAAQRRAAGVAGPPLLVLLHEKGIGSPILPAEGLDTFRAAAISCAVAAARLPPAPDDVEWLESVQTWWLTGLTPGDHSVIRPYLTQVQEHAGHLQIAHFAPDQAVLRTTIPAPQLATVDIARTQADVLPRAA